MGQVCKVPNTHQVLVLEFVHLTFPGAEGPPSDPHSLLDMYLPPQSHGLLPHFI